MPSNFSRALSRRIVDVFGLLLLLALSLPASDLKKTSGPSQKPNAAPSTRNSRSALDAYNRQDYKRAEQELKPLLAAEPNNFDFNQLAGLVYMAEGENEKATPYLSKAARLRPKLSETRIALATNLLRLHRLADAEREFKEAVRLAPNSYQANHNLGEFYAQTGNVSAAVPFLMHAQEIDSRAYDNGYDLALACEQSGELEQARQVLRSLIKVKDSAELHSLLAEVAEKSKDYLEAAREYQAAARLEPVERNLVNWGAELLLHQTFEPAAEVFRAGLVRYPQSIHLRSGLGIALYGMAQYDNAAAEFFKAADIDPSDPLPVTFLGKGYENLSPEVAALVRSRLTDFITRNTNNAAVRLYYALSLGKLNQSQPSPGLLVEMESLLKSAIAIDGDYGEAHLQLGMLYADQRRYKDAIEEYEKALKIIPNDSSVHYRLGQALTRVGDSESAKKQFELFERLRADKVAAENEQHNQIQQFVYTMRKSAAGNE